MGSLDSTKLQKALPIKEQAIEFEAVPERKWPALIGWQTKLY